MKKSKKIVFIIGTTLSMLLCGCGEEEATTGCVFDYENPIWSWSSDYSAASVSFICSDCGKESELFDATIEIDDKKPTCNEGAVDTYTAKVTVNNKQYVDSKTVNESKLGHDYELVVSGTYKKDYEAGEKFDKTGLVLQKICKRDKTHTENVSLSNVLISYVEGDTFKAGDTKAIAKVGTLIADIPVNAVSKARPTITLPELRTTCHTEPDLSGVTASIGEVIVKYYSDSARTNEVTINQLVEGEYFTKGIVEATNDNEYAEENGTLSVTHDFSQTNTDEKFIVSPANCTNNAVYYKSCLCGEKDSNTFIHEGSALGHDFSTLIVTGECKTEYEAFEHFDPSGLTIKKVCSHDESHVMSVESSELSFSYQKGSEFHLGDTKVTLNVGNAKKEIDISVIKANPVINFGALKTKCHTIPDYSSITTSVGTISLCNIYSDSECTQAVKANDLVAGRYYVKATVNESSEWNKAEKVGNLIVEHILTPVTDSKDPTDRIGGKVKSKCSECGEAVEFEEVKTYRGYGMGPLFVGSAYPGTTINGQDLTDYDEYTGSGEWNTYRCWNVNNTTSNISLPRTDFRSFNNISFVFHSNCTSSLFLGFGYAENNDLLAFADHGEHTAFAINASYDKIDKILYCSLDSSNGESAKFQITDQSIIKGDSTINLKIQGAAWRSLVFHNFHVNHICENFGSSKNITSSSCSVCFKMVKVTDKQFVYSTKDFAIDKYGISAEGKEFVTQIDTSEDIGAIKLGQPSCLTAGVIHLARATYSNVNNVVYYFSCNAADSKIGFDSENFVKTVANTTDDKSPIKSTISFVMDQGVLKVTINVAGNTITKDVTDQDIISGAKALDLYVELNAWHYIAISKIVINDSTL